MTGINDIKAMALAYGACSKVLGITSIKEAVELLMTPQGREFAVKSGFPTLQMCRECSFELSRIPRVLLDTSSPMICGQDLLAIGDTKVTAVFSEPDRLHCIVAMHGAKVTVKATNYAVVTVSSYNSEVVTETDGTALVYVEESGKKGGES